MAVYNLVNQTRTAFRAALNTILGKLQQNYYGTVDPASAGESAAGMFWIDTTGAFPVLKVRNASDIAWLNMGTLASSFRPVGAWVEVPPITTNAGTAFDVVSIPPGVTEIEVLFDFVSITANDSLLVQLGPLSGVEAFGYWTGRTIISGTSIASTFVDEQVGFVVGVGSASRAAVGTMRLVRGSSGSLWHQTYSVTLDGVTRSFGEGRKYLTAELDRLRVTRVGSGTFDNGILNIRYR